MRRLIPANLRSIAAQTACAKKLILRAGSDTSLLSSPISKNILLSFYQKSCLIVAVPSRSEGRFAVVTDVEAGCGGRVNVAAWLSMPTNNVDAHGQVAWS
jgi:hypothetical protein